VITLETAEDTTAALAALERTFTNALTIADRDDEGTLSRTGRRAGHAVTVLAVLAAIVLGALTFGPRLLPVQTLVVLSGSMEPVLPVGSLIVLERVDARDIRIGDVITFQRPDRPSELVTHRVVGEHRSPDGARALVTRGDASGAVDPWVVPVTGAGWRTAAVAPVAGYVLEALRSDAARLALLVVPLGALAALALRSIWKAR
jgi:signal peptidase